MPHQLSDNLTSSIVQDFPVERTLFEVNGSRVVLFHKDGRSLEQEFASDYLQLMRSLDLGPVCEVDNDDWVWCRANPVNFNCHTLAVGSAIGLTPTFWLEGVASNLTLNSNPVGTLLTECYRNVTGNWRQRRLWCFAIARPTITHTRGSCVILTIS